MRYTIYQFKGSGKYFYVYNGTPKLISRAIFSTTKDLVETPPNLRLLGDNDLSTDTIEIASCNALSELPKTHPELFI